MTETLSTWEIADRLLQDENAGWSHAGAKAMAEYLEQYEESTGEPVEFDRVAIRCDFSEYGSATEAAEQYTDLERRDIDGQFLPAYEIETRALLWLEDRTSVIQFSTQYMDRTDSGVIIQDF